MQVSGYGRQTYLRDDGKFPRVDEANIVESVDKSLQRLGTDYIDLLQVAVRFEFWVRLAARNMEGMLIDGMLIILDDVFFPCTYDTCLHAVDPLAR